MKRRKIFTRILFAYLLVTTGAWMFLKAYTNSYNKLTTEKITPASIVLKSESAEMSILKTTFQINTENLQPESKLFYALYLLAPDELRMLTSLTGNGML